MISTLLVRKLLLYAAYSAAVTALPVLAYVPLPNVWPPALHMQSTYCDCASEDVADGSAEVIATVDRDDRWWCRGPVRRGVRGVALFISRPWRR